MRHFVLIGHRGVGKTSLMERLMRYFSVSGFDLDAEIEKTTGQSVSQIFASQGEKAFRQLEQKLLAEYFLRPRSSEKAWEIVSIGAGFEVAQFSWPASAVKIWVRRSSDSQGRIFVNRPRLLSDLSPLDEYQKKVQERDQIFKLRADWTYDLPEGLNQSDETEKKIWESFLSPTPNAVLQQAFITVSPLLLKKSKHPLWSWVQNQSPLILEWRTDLLPFTEKVGPNSILSIRTAAWDPAWLKPKWLEIDWALELGVVWPRDVKPTILSSHEDQVSIFDRYDNQSFHFKWSPEVLTWDKLRAGWEWQQQNPKCRSFLPRSREGRWTWFRLLQKAKQKINFVQLEEASSPGQPTLWEWESFNSEISDFAAVLGSPVEQSWSPAFHQSWSHRQGLNFLRIKIEASEWTEAFELLKILGLRAAAITSPLKMKIDSQKSQNTWVRSRLQNEEFSTDTDTGGFETCLQTWGKPWGKVLIWGSGAMGEMAVQFFPGARLASVRQTKTEDFHPFDTLVWAAKPEADLPEGLRARDERGEGLRTLKFVIDLNYREDSRARELAQVSGAQYFSGAEFFKAQGVAQQKFWEMYVK